ncbi:MAG: aminopeptidase N [Hyphomicrobiaceae bacterium]|nr:aminopeptidase N [Hyphomicrobiaceae bacterium]
MKPQTPRTIRLRDYRPPSFTVDNVDLSVSLAPERAVVQSRLTLRPDPRAVGPGEALVLSGSHFELDRLSLNGSPLTRGHYEYDGETLTLHNPPRSAFELTAQTIVNPNANKALQGLYRSKNVYCTQCEAEGFRRITFMIDRPDVLARYRVRLEADRREAPVLLSNGNLTAHGDLTGNRHFAIWDDPFPKSSYLFALVAGDLGSIHSTYRTKSGRAVDLGIFVERGKEPRAAWAMDCLKRAMAWDEARFGREYDLDQFNIVAVSDFNMGAMENKGLNIFNDRLILASAETATDAQYEAIESVVAHEYFHNWTGNRTTCRDWFQLCLKEGLTVYRDQEFSGEQRCQTVQRIADVRQLKATQFPEDAGPLSHPVRPDTYIEINNFYTATIYEKGAELVRMLDTIVGRDVFRSAMDLYFERYDGQAATIEEFLACFETASGHDLSQFLLWYTQPGTPELHCRTSFDRKTRTLDVTLTQTFPERQPAVGHPVGRRKPVPIPVRLGLVDRNGHDLPLRRDGEDELGNNAVHVVLTRPQETYRFTGLDRRPVVSILRGFSAPVRLTNDVADRDLAFLAARDSDHFNRWQSVQHYAMRTLLSTYTALKAGRRSARGTAFAKTLKEAIADPGLEPAYRAELLRLPTTADIMREAETDVDPALAARAQRLLTARVAAVLEDELRSLYRSVRPVEPFSPNAESAGKRALRNVVLQLLTARGTDSDMRRLYQHYAHAANMTDQAQALALLAARNHPLRERALTQFYRRWHHDDVVIDLWFQVQAQANTPATLDRVRQLTGHELFTATTPNKVRALIGAFAHGNPVQFHRPDGEGYEFVADQVLAIDRFNPQVAARLLSSFKSWRTLEPHRRDRARNTLMRVARHPLLSRDVHEIVTKMWER